jgi:hypothetical protein
MTGFGETLSVWPSCSSLLRFWQRTGCGMQQHRHESSDLTAIEGASIKSSHSGGLASKHLGSRTDVAGHAARRECGRCETLLNMKLDFNSVTLLLATLIICQGEPPILGPLEAKFCTHRAIVRCADNVCTCTNVLHGGAFTPPDVRMQGKVNLLVPVNRACSWAVHLSEKVPRKTWKVERARQAKGQLLQT